MKPRILIIDDEPLLRWSAGKKCEEWGYEPVTAADCHEARERMQAENPELVLLDVRLPDGNGVDLLREMRGGGFNGPIVLITADPKLDDIKTALRLGAYDYLAKPINFDELHVTIANALESGRMREELGALREQVKQSSGYHEAIGPSEAMQKLLAFVRRIAASEASVVLLQGESGTGKDLIAKVLHYHSSRADRPFIAINCSAIPESLLEAELFGHERGAFTDAKTMKKGLLETAHGGTLFLDEIGEMPLPLQAKILRVLEGQSFRRLGGVKDMVVDVRLITASNRNLEDAVRTGQFRQDLFYRLMVIPIFIPPLRSRRDDLLPLSLFFISHYNQRFRKKIRGLTPEAEQWILHYDWPGNVRELKNAIQRAMILEDGEWLRSQYLPVGGTDHSAPPAPSPASLPEAQWTPARSLHNDRLIPHFEIPAVGTSLEGVEQHLVEQAMAQCHGNQSQAARLLDISRDAMRYKIKKFNLEKSEEIEK